MATTVEGAHIEELARELHRTMTDARRVFLARIATREADALRATNPLWHRRVLDRAVGEVLAAVARRERELHLDDGA